MTRLLPTLIPASPALAAPITWGPAKCINTETDVAILPDNGTVRTVQAGVAQGSGGKRFLQLKVSKP